MGGMFTSGFWTSYLKERRRSASVVGWQTTYKDALLEQDVLFVRAILFPSSFTMEFGHPLLYLFLVEVNGILLPRGINTVGFQVCTWIELTTGSPRRSCWYIPLRVVS